MIIIQFGGLLWLLVEYFSSNRFSCHFPSFCIPFEVCQLSAGKRIWSVKTFDTHSLVRNSHQNHSKYDYVRSYQRISVSTDALFSITVFNCSSDVLPSFILCYVCLPKLSSKLCRIPKVNLHLGKLKIFSYGILYPP